MPRKATVGGAKRYRETLTQFLNDYWGAFHEVLEAQSVNREMLAGSLFRTVTSAHDRFAQLQASGTEAAVENLDRLWQHVATRRQDTPDAPLTGKEVAYARAQFAEIFDALAAVGEAYPDVSAEVIGHALHGNPKGPLRADAAR